MNVLGMVVEYNPFHNGHLYHLEQAGTQSNADVVVCIMSGPFLQRGEPALVPKRERAEMALSSGADLVIELPYMFACQHADIFAAGAVSICRELGITHLNFGSEHGKAAPFVQLVDFLHTHRGRFDERVRFHIQGGCSYAKANELAYRDLEAPGSLPDLSQPNNILGFHYTNAAARMYPSLHIGTIKRKNASYHDISPRDPSIASATSLRHMLERNEDISAYIPEASRRILAGLPALRYWEDYFSVLQAKMLTMPTADLASLYDMSEGLHHRMQRLMKEATGFGQWLQLVKTKRYTLTRLQRTAVHLLTGLTKEEAHAASDGQHVDHLRVLGMNARGRTYLNKAKKNISIPLYTKMTNKKTPQLAVGERADTAYALLLPPSERQKEWRRDYDLPPLLLF
ncbi:hypothetical protein CHL76_03075 [Marinococcus halophilus]|uniref:tRNA(Met) cytidine acetate ligase n=1 Tax=Marinococcus halophilus TaxID=1371 RepID=A0A510Y280_MARHA|nr:nucleotidyltransferase [Marinococcus halophilus]OZT81352.1 hypothetical protein CHL76_03075 [Marinococcus halophilus]GEK57303.1 UPF0348 protein YlbM [Marinococcus halophilus]